jgi:hypothetical protein
MSAATRARTDQEGRPQLTLAASGNRIMNADEIAREKFHGKKSARWVRGHVPGRIRGSRDALWFESAVDQFLNELREQSA